MKSIAFGLLVFTAGIGMLCSPSCRIMQKARATYALKSDSTGHTHTTILDVTQVRDKSRATSKADSQMVRVLTNNRLTVTTESYDTLIHIEGDSAQVAVLLGVEDKVQYVETPTQLIQVTMLPSQGGFMVKSINKPRNVAVKAQKRTETTEAIKDSTNARGKAESTVINDVAMRKEARAESDQSTRKHAEIKSMSKTKSVNTLIPWWLWVVAGLYAIGSLYFKSINPLRWLSRHT